MYATGDGKARQGPALSQYKVAMVVTEKSVHNRMMIVGCEEQIHRKFDG